ncbi:MAG: sigma-70 family RNA polymerase sigma factor [Lachnospiraceae bacterium]|nr:sigma-70 family RNA polymerase sigma factor [Lachnospiraceae bacterium]
MSGFEALTDEELIHSLNDQKSNIEEYLLEKYKPLVRKIAKTEALQISGGDHDDLLQEGMIGLMKAIKSYDTAKQASFYTFASLCIKRQMISAVQASNRDKNAALNSYVSLSGTMEDERAEERGLTESLNEIATQSTEDVVIDEATAKELDFRVKEVLSDLEKQIYELYLSGMDYGEISQMLGKEKKSIDNAIQRIKKKVREILRSISNKDGKE